MLEDATIASFEANHAQIGHKGRCFLSACYRKALYFASLVTSAGQIAGNLSGNIPPHIIVS